MLERLQKYLSRCGVASRRQSEKLILAGLVKVNGKIVKKLGTKIDPDKDRVIVNDSSISPRRLVYYVVYKPKGYTCTVSDIHADKLVTELVPKDPKVYPVGRLDKNSEGLLLLTNDGTLTQKIAHPSFECEKEYEVLVSGKPSELTIRYLQKGTKLGEYQTKPATIKLIKSFSNTTLYRVILKEGKKRQIRRMFDKFHHDVLKLKRVRIKNLTLDNLKEGEYRKLSPNEVTKLLGS